MDVVKEIVEGAAGTASIVVGLALFLLSSRLLGRYRGGVLRLLLISLMALGIVAALGGLRDFMEMLEVCGLPSIPAPVKGVLGVCADLGVAVAAALGIYAWLATSRALRPEPPPSALVPERGHEILGFASVLASEESRERIAFRLGALHALRSIESLPPNMSLKDVVEWASKRLGLPHDLEVSRGVRVIRVRAPATVRGEALECLASFLNGYWYEVARRILEGPLKGERAVIPSGDEVIIEIHL